MTRNVILLCAAILAAVICNAWGSELFFDPDNDFLPETVWTIGLGQKAVIPVYLSGFTGQTGSFQFNVFYDDPVLSLLDYDTYMGRPDVDPGLVGPIQTKAELGPWGTSQWSSPVTQEINAFDSGQGKMREFYTGGSLTQTATGNGILAYLVFEGMSVGQTTLNLQKPGGTWFLEGITPQPVSQSLNITVIPEPASVFLFGVSIAIFSLRRRKTV
jgi:hypothetical protein